MDLVCPKGFAALVQFLWIFRVCCESFALAFQPGFLHRGDYFRISISVAVFWLTSLAVVARSVVCGTSRRHVSRGPLGALLQLVGGAAPRLPGALSGPSTGGGRGIPWGADVARLFQGRP